MLNNWADQISLPNNTISVFGNQFDDGAWALLKAQSEPSGKAHYLTIANLSAHAIELFLKSLWIYDRPQIPDFRKGGHQKKGALRFIDGRVMAPQRKDGERAGHELTESWKMIPKVFTDQLVAKRPTIEADLEKLNGLFVRTRYVFEGVNNSGIHYKLAAEVSGFLRQMMNDLPRRSIRELGLV